MSIRAIALTSTMLAALSLAACGEEDQAANEAEPTTAEDTASQEAAEAAQDAEQAADAAGDAAENAADATGAAAENAADATEAAAEDAAQATENAAEEAGNELSEATRDAAQATENAAEETGDALANATQEAAQATENAAEETEAAAESVEQEMETSDAADIEASPALAALAGTWAESQNACGRREVTFTQQTVTLPKGECEIQSSEIDDGTLSMGVACGADTGEQQWTLEGAQDEATPQQVTLDRGEGDPIDLVRCS